MRFQTTETVQTPDSEIVLRVLETTLPEISSDVVRDGDQITLRGLGPSPRTRNLRDVTVLHVRSDHETTVISADVSFQASALLGATSQDSVVRSKLSHIFDQVRNQLSLEARRDLGANLVPHPGVFAAEVDSRVIDLPVRPVAEQVELPKQASVSKFTQAASLVEASVAQAESPVAAVLPQRELPGIEPVVEAVVAAAPEAVGPAVAESAPVIANLAAEEKVEPLPVVETDLSAPAISSVVYASAEVARVGPERPLLQLGSSRAHRTHVPALIAAIVALLLLFAVAAYYLLRPNPPETRPTSLPAQMQPVKQSAVGPFSLA
ncbi:MAG TPA: hypothetical protein VIX90_02655 [Edaphobacter sp.]